MLIGSQYADNKMYRGIKHYDSMPLTSGDIHEYSDTAHMKNAYIMNNLLGYGTLNSPNIINDTTGLRLAEPSVVMIDGDISLIQSDDNTPLVSKQDIEDAGYAEGVVCILGWYQSIHSSTTLRNYGGVNNSTLVNDLENPKFNLAISSRYQLRWFPIIVSKENFYNSIVTISFSDRDKDGNILSTSTTANSTGRHTSVVLFDKPASMSYAEDHLYLVPICSYKYVDTTRVVSDVSPYERLYMNSKMAFLQYQSAYIVDTATPTPQDVVIPINVNSLTEGDIIRVIYEGLELAAGIHYTIDYVNQTANLINFTTNVGDMIYFTVTRVSEASNLSNITETFTRHMDTRASSTIEAHVKLSDTLSDSNASQGVAATPKMVKDAITASQILKDETTGKNYRFGVRDGKLYVEEV